MAANTNKLVNINANRFKVEKNNRLAFFKFGKEEAETNRKHERELAELHNGHNGNYLH